MIELLQSESAIIGLLAIITSVITEFTKNIGFLKKIPTVFQVIVTSVVLSVIFYIVECASQNNPIVWYILLIRIIIGIIAAFVSTYGWDRLNEIIKKFSNISKKEE